MNVYLATKGRTARQKLMSVSRHHVTPPLLASTRYALEPKLSHHLFKQKHQLGAKIGADFCSRTRSVSKSEKFFGSEEVLMVVFFNK